MWRKGLAKATNETRGGGREGGNFPHDLSGAGRTDWPKDRRASVARSRNRPLRKICLSYRKSLFCTKKEGGGVKKYTVDTDPGTKNRYAKKVEGQVA